MSVFGYVWESCYEDTHRSRETPTFVLGYFRSQLYACAPTLSAGRLVSSGAENETKIIQSQVDACGEQSTAIDIGNFRWRPTGGGDLV